MIGGELLATGSSSCVFRPTLPCFIGDKIEADKISKIIFSEKSGKIIKNEKKNNEMIRKIKGNEKWAITFERYCKPLKMNDILTYDQNGMIDCEEGMDDIKLFNFDENSQMLIGKYGGETFEKYFLNLFKTQGNISQKFLQIANMMKPLFHGLEVMEKNNICHNDIKYNNIVLSDGVFKYIDFGLSDKTSNLAHFKNRSISEFNTNRLYVFYPIEYIYSFANENQLYNEITKNRKNLNKAEYLSMIFDRDYYSDLRDIIDRIVNKEIDFKKLIKGIDVYSLGSIIPLLLYNIFKGSVYDIIKRNKILVDFFKLFEKMLNPNYKKRLSGKQANQMFKRLLNKYNGSGKKKTKKRTKKLKRKSKKSKKGKKK